MILTDMAEKLKRRSNDDFKGRHFEAWLMLSPRKIGTDGATTFPSVIKTPVDGGCRIQIRCATSPNIGSEGSSATISESRRTCPELAALRHRFRFVRSWEFRESELMTVGMAHPIALTEMPRRLDFPAKRDMLPA